MLDEKIIPDLEKKVIVSNDPFPHAVINNFLRLEIVKRAEQEFIDLNQSVTAGSPQFQKTKKVLYDYLKMPFAFHVKRNSAQLMRNVQAEVEIFSANIATAITTMGDVISILALFALLLFVEIKITLLVIFLVMFLSYLIYNFTKKLCLFVRIIFVCVVFWQDNINKFFFLFP